MFFQEYEIIKLFHTMEDVSRMYSGLDVHVYKDNEGAGKCFREGQSAIIWLDPEYGFGAGSKEEQEVFLFGVFAHELMHLLRTDFDHEELMLQSCPAVERSGRHMMSNIIEDPAIEFFAGQHIGSFLLQCLQCVIERSWGMGPDIQSGTDAYEQFLAAMIQFCDVGLLKGQFTFPEAEGVFYKAIQVADKAIEEPSFEKRYRYAMEIYEIAVPLLRKHQERMDANRSEKKLLKALGKSLCGKPGSGKPVLEDVPALGGSVYSKKRKKLIARKKEEGSPADERMPSVLMKCTGGALPGRQDPGPSGAMGTRDAGLKKQEGPDIRNPAASEKAGLPSKDLLEELKGLLESTGKKDSLGNCPVPDAPRLQGRSLQQELDASEPEMESPFLQGIRVTSLDKEVSSQDYVRYYARVERLRPQTEALVSQLKKIFHEDRERKSYRTSGKMDLGRACGKRRVTARIFSRRQDPSGKINMSVCILVDLSTSMRRRIEDLKDTCTVILEALSRFRIHAKVIGFSSGVQGVDSLHCHFGSWENEACDRKNLEAMKCSGETFLGYAVRHASGLLKKQKEKYKLFMVITDGKPQYRAYRNLQDGLDDFQDAMRKAKMFSDVVGIGVFSQNEAEKYGEYFEDFLIMEDTADLACVLSSRLKAIVKKW